MPCNNCNSFGLSFDRAYEPQQAIAGSRNSRIWIIGLNPAQDQDWIDQRQINDLINYFGNQATVHRYFKRFRIVSETLYNQFGADHGVAHTDLVKCFSPTWPPEGVTAQGRSQIIANCTSHLQGQLREFSPEIIICNGSEVSAEVKRLLPPSPNTSSQATTYTYEDGERSIQIVLSGFIGRIDNYSKRRLGVEIEALISALPGQNIIADAGVA